MTFVPFMLDDQGHIALDEEQVELAFARSTILRKICQENMIPTDEAMIALAVFVGRELRDCDDKAAWETIHGLNHLMWKVAHKQWSPQ